MAKLSAEEWAMNYASKLPSAFPNVNTESSPAKSDASFLGKYNVENLMYPMDLFDPKKPSGPYVLFMINDFDYPSVTNKEEYLAKQDNDKIQQERKRGFAARMGMSEAAVKGAAVTESAIAGVGLGSLLTGNVDMGSVKTGAMAGIATAGMLNMAGLKFEKSQQRLKKAIALHMPNNLSISYSSEYGSTNARNMLALGQIFGDIGGIAESAINTVKEKGLSGVEDSAKDMVNRFTESPIASLKKGVQAAKDSKLAQDAKDIGGNLALTMLPGAGTISSISGIAANPKLQAVFEGVRPREFTMHYTFFPKSPNELNNIRTIIQTFKKHMLPAYKDENEWLFVYPSEFDITYYMGDKENEYIHKHTSCVLTDMNINYTPDGNFTHFSNGAPTRIEINLSFREVDIVTRKDAEAGY